MTSRIEGGIVYTRYFNAENRLITVTTNSGATTTFAYDGDGSLVKTTQPDGSVTVYVGGVYEVLTLGGVTTRTTYYNALTARAMRVETGGTGQVYYILTDQLGSASVTLDSGDNVVGEMRYYAFGETRLVTGSMWTDKLYTGQRSDAGIGLYNFNARFYDPLLKRFISADTIVPNPGDPQSLNRYTFAYNNPLGFIDPTGHNPVSCYGKPDCGIFDDDTPTPLTQPTPPPSTPPTGNGGGTNTSCYGIPDCGVDNTSWGGGSGESQPPMPQPIFTIQTQSNPILRPYEAPLPSSSPTSIAGVLALLGNFGDATGLVLQGGSMFPGPLAFAFSAISQGISDQAEVPQLGTLTRVSRAAAAGYKGYISAQIALEVAAPVAAGTAVVGFETGPADIALCAAAGIVTYVAAYKLVSVIGDAALYLVVFPFIEDVWRGQ